MTNKNNENRDALYQKCKVVTGKGRLSYAFIWEPKEQKNGDSKYSTSFLIPKTDTKTLTKIKEAINAAAQLGQATKWGGKIPSPLKHPLRDGDAEADEKGEEYRGHFFFNATSSRKPRVVDLQIQDIWEQDEVYSGCYARLSINFYPYNSDGSKGVACGLNHVQKVEDGESFAGVRTNAEEDFADMDDLDIPFGEPGTGETNIPVAATATAKTEDDILSGINFTAA